MSKSSQGRDQLVREARIALPILGLLLLVFVFAAYRRISGWSEAPPARIRSAPQSEQPDDDRTQEVSPGAEIRRPKSNDEFSIVPPSRRTSDQGDLNPARRPIPERSPAIQRPENPRSNINRNPDDSSARPLTLPTTNPRTSSVPATDRSNLVDPTGPNNIASETAEDVNADRQPEQSIEGVRVTVLDGDSYWTIAERGYGDGQYFRAVHAYVTSRMDPSEVSEGSLLILPTTARLRELHPELCPAERRQVDDSGSTQSGSSGNDRFYVTRGGETLFQISATYLGQASRYTEIIALNGSRLPDSIGPNDPLAADIQIAIPASVR